jgi:diacylglycerol kinase family enzyme
LLSLVIYVLSFGQNMRWMTVYTIKKAQLTTIPKLDISVDGEVTEQTPATITTQKTPINILVPKKT